MRPNIALLLLFSVLCTNPIVALADGASGATPAATSAPAAPPATGTVWQKVNTPATAEQISFFAINKSNHWFISDRRTGFYRSTDQGATWTQINKGIASPFGWTIQVNPANGDLIAGTCSCTKANQNPVGFFRSTDEGATWKEISGPGGFHLSLAGAQNGCAFASNGNIVCGGYFGQGIAWVSTNNGKSTRTIDTDPVIGTAYAFGFNPINKDLWLGTEQKGVFRSTDNGLHWKQVSPNATSLDPAGVRNGNIYGITFDRNGNTLLSSAGGVWKSSPSGSGYTWKWVLKNTNTSAGKGIGIDGAGNLYWGHNRDTLNPIVIYRSTDDGETWSEFDSGIPKLLEGHGFTYNPFDGQVYAVIEDGPTNNGWVYRTGQ